MKFDLHVHSRLSYDCNMPTDELISVAKEKGLSGVAIADHNAFRKHHDREDFYLIPACEFSTDIGHLVVLFMKSHINESISRDEMGRFYWRDVCKVAHDQGALVFYAHPFSPSHTYPKSTFDEIDGIEVFNSRVVHSRIKNANNKALELCRKLKKPYTAGSDAHSPVEIGTTYWECDLPESAMNEPDFEERLKAALLSSNGRVFAGAASPFAVLKCKRYMYRHEKLWGRLIKSYFILIYTAIRSLFKKRFEGRYIDVYGEAEK
ncbi:MAG: PHP domain-containing protein [Oscillospiraceae bacterium]|nr:PHP domain-containing protein [Oscillospiraceae bacterium]